MNTSLPPPIQPLHNRFPPRSENSFPIYRAPNEMKVMKRTTEYHDYNLRRDLSDHFPNVNSTSDKEPWQTQPKHPPSFNSNYPFSKSPHGYPAAHNPQPHYGAPPYNYRVSFRDDRRNYAHKYETKYTSSLPNYYNNSPTPPPDTARHPFVSETYKQSAAHNLMHNQSLNTTSSNEQKKKHRRLFSSETSITISPTPQQHIQQNYIATQTTKSEPKRTSLHHKRESSAGLEILSIAADVSKQELAAAADNPLLGGHHKRNLSGSSFPSSSGSFAYHQRNNSLWSIGSAMWENKTHKRVGSNWSTFSAVSGPSEQFLPSINGAAPPTREINIMPPPPPPPPLPPPPPPPLPPPPHSLQPSQSSVPKPLSNTYMHPERHQIDNHKSSTITFNRDETIITGVNSSKHQNAPSLVGEVYNADSPNRLDEKIDTGEKLFTQKGNAAIPQVVTINTNISASSIGLSDNAKINTEKFYSGDLNCEQQPLSLRNGDSKSSERKPTYFNDVQQFNLMKQVQSEGKTAPTYPSSNSKERVCMLAKSDNWDMNNSKMDANMNTLQKRSRRKCTIASCPNRVVQGGLCISHGAKRKICSVTGCTKNVKKAGLCSTHGPARKRCEIEGCVKVCVQGGRCIAHGAKKKLCKVNGCKKQAILTGMCKKHHDEHNGIVKKRRNNGSKVINDKMLMDKSLNFNENEKFMCVEVSEDKQMNKNNRKSSPSSQTLAASNQASSKISNSRCTTSLSKTPLSETKHHHKRGLSLFHDLNTVNTIIQNDNISKGIENQEACTIQIENDNTNNEETNVDGSKRRKKKPGHQRGLSIFADKDVAENIIKKKIII